MIWRGEIPMPEPLVEGIDYYLEQERWVFTAHFLRKRGHCCESRCRHCPYGFNEPRANEPTETPREDKAN